MYEAAYFLVLLLWLTSVLRVLQCYCRRKGPTSAYGSVLIDATRVLGC